MKRAALYARVSTGGQTVENQLRELRQVAARLGWEVVEEFIDQGISGAKGRDRRPALDSMLKSVIRSEVDVVAAWSVDRLGRSLQDLVGVLTNLLSSHLTVLAPSPLRQRVGYIHRRLVTTSVAGRSISICTSRASTRPRHRVGRCTRCSASLPSSSARYLLS